MRILVINPNTSERMTHHLCEVLERRKSPGTEIAVLNPPVGPVSIESAYDEAFAILPTLELLREVPSRGYDAVVLACFSDLGLDAARELLSVPVVGIEEASLHVAAMLGDRFSVLTSRRERVPSRIAHVERLGLRSRLASVLALDMSVLEMDAEPERAKTRILALSAQAVREDGAEVIVMGCAGLAGYAEEIHCELGVVVLDPTPVALKVAELLVSLGLAHSKCGLYAFPPAKVLK